MAPGDLLLTGTPGGTALKAPAKAAREAGRAAAARHPVEAVLRAGGAQPPVPARRRRHHRDDRLRRRAAEPRHPAQHRDREDAMNTPEILPPAGLDLPAAAGRRPDLARQRRHAVDPRPRRLHALPGLDLRRPGRHGDTDRQRADRARGAPARRGHAQRPQHLDAVRHDPGRAGRRDRRPGQPHPQRRPPGRADPPGTVPSGRDGRAGTERATVAADAGGGPPRRGDRRSRAPARRSPWGSAGPANRRPGRPGPDRGLPGRGDRRAAIRPPGGRPSRSRGTSPPSCTPAAPPAPRRSPPIPTPTSSPAAAASPRPRGWRPGKRRWAGCRCSTSTR